MLWAGTLKVLKQESVSLVMNKVTAILLIPESGLVQEGILITPTRVETWQRTPQIMEASASKPWDTSWCSESKNWRQHSGLQQSKIKTVDLSC